MTDSEKPRRRVVLDLTISLLASSLAFAGAILDLVGVQNRFSSSFWQGVGVALALIAAGFVGFQRARKQGWKRND
jgi:hypothetical protein